MCARSAALLYTSRRLVPACQARSVSQARQTASIGKSGFASSTLQPMSAKVASAAPHVSSTPASHGR